MERKLIEVVKEAEYCLENAAISDAKVDAWYLFESVYQMNRMQYLMNQNEVSDPASYEKYMQLIEKRCKHIPLQHLIGTQEFMGFEFNVNEHVLIPRQDTECLVEEVIPYAMGKSALDVCTGSGCIIISLAKLCGLSMAKAVDISEEALCVAKENAKKLDAEVTFLKSDLFTEVEGKFDVIVSNPPYIRTAVIDTLMEEVREHEPMLALDGKEDGLYFYRLITEQAGAYLNKNGMLFFEIGYDQGEEVKELMEQHGFINVAVKKDLAGLDRIVFGLYKP